jgi:hypothetical protein
MDFAVYSAIFPFVVLGIVLFAAVLILKASTRKTQHKNYRPSIGYRYAPENFSRQMELDMRLPYRRFKQLYPYSNWTYEEYKRMQKKTAFRRSTSSQQNKRMVR